MKAKRRKSPLNFPRFEKLVDGYRYGEQLNCYKHRWCGSSRVTYIVRNKYCPELVLKFHRANLFETDEVLERLHEIVISHEDIERIKAKLSELDEQREELKALRITIEAMRKRREQLQRQIADREEDIYQAYLDGGLA